MTEKDELLEGLARAAREEDEGDALLRRLASSELSPAERAELEERARTDGEAARALAAYRPLDGADLDRMAAAIAPPPAPARAPSSRRGRAVAWLALPLAAAAALWLFVRAPAEELPAYELGFAANIQVTRADGPSEPVPEARVSRRATFELDVRPAQPARGPVAARAVLVRDGHARAWGAPITVSPEGAVRVVGPVPALFPEPSGAYDVVVAVGRPGDLPSDEGLIAIAEGRGSARGVRVVRGRVVLVE